MCRARKFRTGQESTNPAKTVAASNQQAIDLSAVRQHYPIPEFDQPLANAKAARANRSGTIHCRALYSKFVNDGKTRSRRESHWLSQFFHCLRVTGSSKLGMNRAITTIVSRPCKVAQSEDLPWQIAQSRQHGNCRSFRRRRRRLALFDSRTLASSPAMIFTGRCAAI